MPYTFKTYENRPVVLSMSHRKDLSEYAVTIEFARKPANITSGWTSFLTLPVEVDGNDLTVSLDATQVNSIKGAYFRIRAVGDTRSFIVDNGRLHFSERPPLARIEGNDLILLDAAGIEYNVGSIHSPHTHEEYVTDEDLAAALESGGSGPAPDLTGYVTDDELADALEELGTSDAHANALARRDDNANLSVGRMYLVNGTSEATEAARKDYVDAGDTAAKDRANHTGTQSADTIVNGETNIVFTKGDKEFISANTYEAHGWHLVRRDGDGRARFAAPVDDQDAANKGYVDPLKARANHTGTQSATTVDSYLPPGGEDGTGRVWINSWDKEILTGASPGSADIVDTGWRVVRRDGYARAHFGHPVEPTHAATMGYVDGLIAALDSRLDALENPE